MISWRKLLTVQSLGFVCLLGAACSGGDDAVEERVLGEATYDERDVRQKYIQIAYADWVATCRHNHRKRPVVREEADCKVRPWDGETDRRGRARNVRNAVIVDLAQDHNPRLMILPMQGVLDELRCGTARVTGEQARATRPTATMPVLLDNKAALFLDEMVQNDCELEFTPLGAAAPTVHKISHRGFAEALTYAHNFIQRAQGGLSSEGGDGRRP